MLQKLQKDCEFKVDVWAMILRTSCDGCLVLSDGMQTVWTLVPRATET